MIENHFQYLGMSVQRISMPAKNSSICRGRGQGRAQGWVPMPVVALHQFRAKFKPHYLLLQAPPSDQHAQPAEQWKPATHSHVGWERRVGNVHVGANGGNCVGQHCTGTSGESPLPVKLLKETAERKGHRQDRPCSKQHHTRHAHPGVVPPVRPSPATPPLSPMPQNRVTAYTAQNTAKLPWRSTAQNTMLAASVRGGRSRGGPSSTAGNACQLAGLPLQ